MHTERRWGQAAEASPSPSARGLDPSTVLRDLALQKSIQDPGKDGQRQQAAEDSPLAPGNRRPLQPVLEWAQKCKDSNTEQNKIVYQAELISFQQSKGLYRWCEYSALIIYLTKIPCREKMHGKRKPYNVHVGIEILYVVPIFCNIMANDEM